MVLSPTEIRGLIDQAKSLGCRRVILVDAEEGNYADLRRLIDDLVVAGQEVELYTDTITGELALFLHQRGVHVSLGIEPKSMLQQGDGLQLLGQAGYTKLNGPRLALRLFAGSANVEEIPAMWRRARSMGIEPKLQIITPRGTVDSPTQLLSPDRARLMFQELGRIDAEEFNRPWSLPPALTGRSCERHLFACHVTACGTIFACVGVTIALGNLRIESLREILLYSEVLENIRAFHEKVKEPCRTCSKTVDCYGCRGSAYQLTGDYMAGDSKCWKADGFEIPVLPVQADHLIPHGTSMRMINQLVQVGERQAATHFEVRADSPWTDEQGRLDDMAYIEMMAQSFAASHGFHLSAEERPLDRGLLLGIKNLVISGEAHVGDRLTIHVRKVARFGDFGLVDGEVQHDTGDLLATGQIKVWRPSDEALKAMMP